MDILRIKIPYKDIYTSVFLIRTPQGDVIFDTAATDEDVENYILPAIKLYLQIMACRKDRQIIFRNQMNG